MAVGVVLRSHAGGYLVYLPEHDLTLQCQARGRLKKERVSILTGDRVEIEDLDSAQDSGVISTRLERSSLLSRPQIANVDQVVIVQAVRQPEWNQLWCDRYIVHFQLELPDSVPVLCFNKCDLVGSDQQERLCRIYESLGYRVVMVSAKTSHGIE
ncbi:MAG TPA: GTPase RsgA, partial [Candidatus Melainabacteria bacterium]|nr:GTPase RsgA [Candidatus Melainabacteria bacterium]